MAKFLDDKGVSKLWNKIKSVFATKSEVNNKMNNGIIQTYRGNEVSFKTTDGNHTSIYFNYRNEQNKPITSFSFGVGNGTTSPKATINCGNVNCAAIDMYGAITRANAEYMDFVNANGVNWGLKGRKSTVHDLGAMQDDINNRATKTELANLNEGVNELGLEVQGQGSDITSLKNNKAEKSELSSVNEQVRTNTSEIQQRIMKAELSFSLSGSTLTITKRY